jgi:hypothetical protein
MLLEFKTIRMLPVVCAALTMVFTTYPLPMQAGDKRASGTTEQGVAPKEIPSHGERTLTPKSAAEGSGKDGQAKRGSSTGVGQWPPGRLRPVQEN